MQPACHAFSPTRLWHEIVDRMLLGYLCGGIASVWALEVCCVQPFPHAVPPGLSGYRHHQRLAFQRHRRCKATHVQEEATARLFHCRAHALFAQVLVGPRGLMLAADPSSQKDVILLWPSVVIDACRRRMLLGLAPEVLVEAPLHEHDEEDEHAQMSPKTPAPSIVAKGTACFPIIDSVHGMALGKRLAW